MVSASSQEFKESYHDHIRKDVVPFVPTTDGTVLDVGGGVGATAAFLKARGKARRAGAIDAMDPKLAVDGLDFFYQGDIQDPEFLMTVREQEGPFGVILALDVLEHLLAPWDTVRSLAGMLTPGGYLVASVPNVRHWRTSSGLFFGGHWEYRDHGVLDRTHLRFFVRETAVELVRQGGLKIRSVDPTLAGRARLLNRLTLGALQNLTALQYVIVAQGD